jgi:hypothetical protein
MKRDIDKEETFLKELLLSEFRVLDSIGAYQDKQILSSYIDLFLNKNKIYDGITDQIVITIVTLYSYRQMYIDSYRLKPVAEKMFKQAGLNIKDVLP